MKYVPHLIPDKARVLHGYFQGHEYGEKILGPNKFLSISAAVVFYLFALANVTHGALFVLFALMGTGMLPAVHRWLERKLHFQFTVKIKAALYVILLIPCLSLYPYYQQLDKEIARQEQLQQAQQQREKRALAVRDSIRKDSFTQEMHFLNNASAVANMDQQQIDERYERALTLAIDPGDKAVVENARLEIEKVQVLSSVKSGKYEDALPSLDLLLERAPNDVTLLYNRAICNDKLGNVAAAVKDLRQAMEAGDEVAEKYHEKINPERRRVSEYVTRCCDGSTSYAKGRGACSHHGGVCNWNEPIYETYRKY